MTASVLIIGGGFAGLACALQLDARRFAVTLIDRQRYFEFIPNIHELISGVKTARDLRLPLGRLLRDRGHRFHCGEVTAVHAGERRVALADGRQFAADYLVIATGSVDAQFGIPGVGRHTLSLKSVADGRDIAARLSGARAARRIVVAGAGLAGMEALGELLRRRPPASELHVVEARDRLLPAAPACVSRHLQALCAEHGVALHLGERVERVTAKTVWLASGRRLRSDATLWTAGPAPPPLLADAALAGPSGWVDVAGDLSVPGLDGVFAAGDSAQLPKALSRQAYFALDMGNAVATAIQRRESGRRSSRFRPLPRPTLLSFGDITCILIAGHAFAGRALMAAKEAVYTLVMARLDRRRPRARIGGLLQRGRGSQALLWPLLNPADLLRSGRVERLG